MISGKNLSLLLTALLLTSQTLAAGPPVPALEEILIRNEQPLELRYQEEKTLVILDQSLTSHGHLRFIPPDTLERAVSGWRDRVYRIEGNRIIISEGGQALRELDLQSYPELTGFAVTLRALLAGDVETLNDQYQLTLTGSANSWLLQLVPRGQPLSQLIDKMLIGGDKVGIREVRTYEQSGNYTRMVLMPDE